MNNKEVAQKIVDRMLETIAKEGRLPWVKPWSEGQKSVRVIDGVTTITIPVEHWSRSGKPYQGINNLLLDFYGKSGEMITFNQCKAEGGKIKKGAKSATIVYWNMIKKETDDLDEDGKKIIITIPVLKTYNVFSVEQDCEGLEVKHHPEPITIKTAKWHYEPVEGADESDRLNEAAESIIADYLKRAGTLSVDDNGDSAYYSPAFDKVVVPNIRQYKETEEYYSTLFHELGHSTGHSSRLDRGVGLAAFGTPNYSKEELVAEITAASILSILGMESGNTFRNSTAYVQNWSEQIKADPMLFVSASGKAEKAIEMILGQA